MSTQKQLAVRRQRKRWRVRKKIVGTAERPRLTVFRSQRQIYAQLVDDLSGVTLAAATSFAKGGPLGNDIEAAAGVGRRLAEAAKAAGVTKAAFDRGGYKYHGRVKALADAAREGGLQF